MKTFRFFVFPAFFAILLMFTSCTDFFSNSMAPWAARDPDRLVPAVTTGNLDELMALTENSPDMSLALLKRLEKAASGASGESRQQFQEAALEVSVNAAGLGQAILGAASDLSAIDSANAQDLFIDAIDSMKNLDASAELLFDIIDDDFEMDAADPDNLAMAAVILLAGEAKKSPDTSDYITFFPPSPSTPEVNRALQMADVAKDGVSETFKEILTALNLI